MNDPVKVGTADLYHGDCSQILPQLTESFDVCLFDPPYIRRTEYASTMRWNSNRFDYAAVYESWFSNLYEEVARLTKPRGFCYSLGNDETFVTCWVAAHTHFYLSMSIVWDKVIGVNGYVRRKSHDLIMMSRHETSPKIATCLNSVITCKPLVKKGRNHPNQLPNGLIRELIFTKHKSPELCVLDPFMGSGILAEWCILNGLRYVGIEMDGRFFKGIVTRCKKTLEERDKEKKPVN